MRLLAASLAAQKQRASLPKACRHTSASFFQASTPRFCAASEVVEFTQTLTRNNTNPNGTEANAAGTSVRVFVVRESKREES
jgi:hypothetical protein